MTSARRVKRRLEARLARLPLRDLHLSDGFALHYYILKGTKRAVPVPFWRAMRWIRERTPPNQARVTLTIAHSRAGHYMVSTIFLMLDHGFMSKRPVLFETMAFWEGPKPYIGHDYGRRYYTWAEAIRGHRALVAKLSNQPGAKWPE
jgi:hypothetical protein